MNESPMSTLVLLLADALPLLVLALVLALFVVLFLVFRRGGR